MNNEILKPGLCLNEWLYQNQTTSQLNFKSNIFYERATLDDFRYTPTEFGCFSVQGRVSQDRILLH